MRKRLKKKVSKYRCLKCGSTDGTRRWFPLKTGRYVSSRLYCFDCDLTKAPSEIER